MLPGSEQARQCPTFFLAVLAIILHFNILKGKIKAIKKTVSLIFFHIKSWRGDLKIAWLFNPFRGNPPAWKFIIFRQVRWPSEEKAMTFRDSGTSFIKRLLHKSIYSSKNGIKTIFIGLWTKIHSKKLANFFFFDEICMYWINRVFQPCISFFERCTHQVGQLTCNFLCICCWEFRLFRNGHVFCSQDELC